jgi:hypothetical protein
MSGRLVQIKQISEIYDDMGDWSKFIVNHFWPEQTPKAISEPELFGH